MVQFWRVETKCCVGAVQRELRGPVEFSQTISRVIAPLHFYSRAAWILMILAG